jgi:hypothetical protein
MKPFIRLEKGFTNVTVVDLVQVPLDDLRLP